MPRARLRLAGAALAASALLPLLAGCALWRPVTVPIATIERPAPCAAARDTLLVLLPGSYSYAKDFESEGFVDAVRRRGIAADLVLVDAHVGYYQDRSIVDRLQADVIAPAIARGVQHVWIAGISIGALGSLLTVRDRPARIDGLVLLGPYLGERATAAEIRAQGGLRTWRAPPPAPDSPGKSGADASIWRWLQPYASSAAPADRPLLFLAYGRDDRFAAIDALLAAALPPDRVFTAPGGHDWDPWRGLWARVLDTLPLPRDAACRTAPG